MEKMSYSNNLKGDFDIIAGGQPVMAFRSDIVPKTAENFRAFCSGEKGYRCIKWMRAHIMVILVLVSLSWCVQADPHPPPPGTVYRYDDRGPEVIFSQGFRAAGLDADIIHHAMGIGMYRAAADCTVPTENGSAFVSTTDRFAVAQRMASGRLQTAPGETAERRVWIYTIRANGRFFGIQRSLQRAMDRMEECEVTGVLQARLTTLDSLVNVARRESEWAAYRYIPPRLIYRATQYRLNANGDIEEIPGTQQDNPNFINTRTHGNTTPWLIDALPRPERAMMFRVYNQANVATMNMLDRLRNATFGSQFCTPSCLSPPSTSRSKRSTSTPPPSNGEINSVVNKVTQQVLAEDLRDLAKPTVCVVPRGYDPPESRALSSDEGNCEAPVLFNINGMVPNGYVWVDAELGVGGQLAETDVPWASWDVDKGNGRKEMPVYCTISLGPQINGAVSVTCQTNPYFTSFYVILRGAFEGDKIKMAVLGTTTDGVTINATQIPLDGQNRMLADIAQGSVRRERLIQEVFNSPDWGSSIVVAPVYIAPNDPHPSAWHDDL